MATIRAPKGQYLQVYVGPTSRHYQRFQKRQRKFTMAESAAVRSAVAAQSVMGAVLQPVGGSLVDWYNNMMVDSSTNVEVAAKQQALLARGGTKGNIDPLRAQELSAEAAFDASNPVMFTGAVGPQDTPSYGMYEGMMEGANYELDLAKRGVTAAAKGVHDVSAFAVGSVFSAIPASVWLLAIVGLAVYTYPSWGPTAGALAKRKIDAL